MNSLFDRLALLPEPPGAPDLERLQAAVAAARKLRAVDVATVQGWADECPDLPGQIEALSDLLDDAGALLFCLATDLMLNRLRLADVSLEGLADLLAGIDLERIG